MSPLGATAGDSVTGILAGNGLGGVARADRLLRGCASRPEIGGALVTVQSRASASLTPISATL